MYNLVGGLAEQKVFVHGNHALFNQPGVPQFPEDDVSSAASFPSAGQALALGADVNSAAKAHSSRSRKRAPKDFQLRRDPHNHPGSYANVAAVS